MFFKLAVKYHEVEKWKRNQYKRKAEGKIKKKKKGMGICPARSLLVSFFCHLCLHDSDASDQDWPQFSTKVFLGSKLGSSCTTQNSDSNQKNIYVLYIYIKNICVCIYIHIYI